MYRAPDGRGTPTVTAGFGLYDIEATTGVRADHVETHLNRLRDGRNWDAWRFTSYDPACNPLLSVSMTGKKEAGYYKRRRTRWQVVFNLGYRDVGNWVEPSLRVLQPRATDAGRDTHA